MYSNTPATDIFITLLSNTAGKYVSASAWDICAENWIQ